MMCESTHKVSTEIPRRRRGPLILCIQTAQSLPGVALSVGTSFLLTGCSFAHAPSFELFGAYFPAWMLCGLIGIVGAASARMVLTNPGGNDVIPMQLAVCTAVGVIAALLTWTVLFR